MRILRSFKAAGALLFALVLVGLTVGTAAADDPTLAELKARIDALEKQNKELEVKFQKQKEGYEPENPGTPQPNYNRTNPENDRINKQIDAYMKDRDTKTKADDAKKKADDALKASLKEEEGYKVGTDLGLTARWNYQQGLLFETKNKDIRSHLGFFFQGDSNFFTQSPQLKPGTQLNDLQDGSFFRRIRPLWDGNAYDTFEWNIILALEQLSNISGASGSISNLPRGQTLNTGNGNGLINLDEMWVGLYNLPFIGRFRAGHLKVPQGLEGNQYSSSRAMTFQENAAYTDAFYNVFGTGVQILNSAFDDRMTWQGMFYRDDFSRGNTGAQFGDGTYNVTGRITGLLIDECEDRHLMHVGLSGTWRKSTRPDNSGTGAGTEGGETGVTSTRLRARPELRDAIGGYGDGFLPGDAGRLVDTGVIPCESTTVVGAEWLYILGPLSFQSEYALCYLNNALTGTGAAAVNRTRSFNGGYVSVSYFLTGETRAFNKSQGIFSTFYIDRPFTNFWFNRREDGSLTWGPGAWEVAARYSYLNLNDGPIQGGVLEGTTLGLNWYLSTNVKFQFEYLDNNRYHKASGANGNNPGVVQGFGTRVQLQF